MKAIIISDADARALLDKLELAKLRGDGHIMRDDGGPPIRRRVPPPPTCATCSHWWHPGLGEPSCRLTEQTMYEDDYCSQHPTVQEARYAGH